MSSRDAGGWYETVRVRRYGERAKDKSGEYCVPDSSKPECAYCGRPARKKGDGLYTWTACGYHSDLPGLEAL